MEAKELEPIEVNPSILTNVDAYNLEDANYDLLVQMGIDVSEVKTYAQWLLGKLANHVVKKNGDLDKYAQEINQNRNTLEGYMSIYRKYTNEDPSFTPQKYYGSVPWGVLALVAHKSDTPGELVEELHSKSENGRLTLKGTYRDIMKKKTDVEVPKKPYISLKWDINVNKYRLGIDPNELDLIDWSDVKDQLTQYLSKLD